MAQNRMETQRGFPHSSGKILTPRLQCHVCFHILEKCEENVEPSDQPLGTLLFFDFPPTCSSQVNQLIISSHNM